MIKSSLLSLIQFEERIFTYNVSLGELNFDAVEFYSKRINIRILMLNSATILVSKSLGTMFSKEAENSSVCVGFGNLYITSLFY